MFTGIIEATGVIDAVQKSGDDLKLTVKSDLLDFSDVALGDSIAVNGVCLTAIELSSHSFLADVSSETLSSSTFTALLKQGLRVNLEKALTLSTRLGGHMVSGHVDGVGKIIAIENVARSVRFKIEAPKDIAKYIAAKGSITVDGVSLTVNKVLNNTFELNIVPHTLKNTTLHEYQKGRQINLEVDLIARYLERLTGYNKGAEKSCKVTEEFLSSNGFV